MPRIDWTRICPKLRVAADGFDGLRAYCGHADGGGGGPEGDMEIAGESGDFSDDVDHVMMVVVILPSTLRWAWSRQEKGIMSGGGLLSGLMSKRVMVFMVVAVVADEADVDAHQEGEHERLHEADEEFENVEGEKESGAVQQILATKHVAKESE